MTPMEENTLDFNFWPSFSDLMLTLVLILVIVVFAVIAAFSVGQVEPPSVGTVDLTEVEEKQLAIIHAIAAQYGVEPKEPETDSFVIPISLENGGYTEILIQNEATLQRYSFSDRILFEPDKYDLNEEGEKTLLIVGNQIKTNLNSISEIQIQGHADPDPPAFVPSNLHLAALRAIEVYTFLQEQIHIDPARHLMSATSFGEYKPVQRSIRDNIYTPEKLQKHNSTKALKAKNRRMEILLFYRFE
jgi:flagellar motor protein MotB